MIVACVDSVQRGDDAPQTDSPWSMGDLRVPMRDGVGLFIDVCLLPGDGPFPVGLTRVPYGKRSGYVFLTRQVEREGGGYEEEIWRESRLIE